MEIHELKRYRETCPNCSKIKSPVNLWFEMHVSLRITRVVLGKNTYKAECPQCKSIFRMPTSK